MNAKLCMLFLVIGSTYFINECRAEKPEIAYLSRFLFQLGKSFIPTTPCAPAKAAPAKAAAPVVALEEPDDEEQVTGGLADFEPSPAPLTKPSIIEEEQVEEEEVEEEEEKVEEEEVEEEDTTEEATEPTKTEVPE